MGPAGLSDSHVDRSPRRMRDNPEASVIHPTQRPTRCQGVGIQKLCLFAVRNQPANSLNPVSSEKWGGEKKKKWKCLHGRSLFI